MNTGERQLTEHDPYIVGVLGENGTHSLFGLAAIRALKIRKLDHRDSGTLLAARGPLRIDRLAVGLEQRNDAVLGAKIVIEAARRVRIVLIRQVWGDFRLQLLEGLVGALLVGLVELPGLLVRYGVDFETCQYRVGVLVPRLCFERQRP